MQLPNKPSEVSYDFWLEKILLVGLPKIGKSEFASGMEDEEGRRPLFLDGEKTLEHLPVLKVDINSWDDVREAYAALKAEKDKNGKIPYCSVVFDTIDTIGEFCLHDVCKDRGITYPADEEWGKGWSILRGQFTRTLLAFAALETNLMFIGHINKSEVKTRNQTITRVEPVLSAGVRKVILGFVDAILYAGFAEDDSEEHILYSQGCEYREAGTRLSEIYPVKGPLRWEKFYAEWKVNQKAFLKKLKGGAAKK